MKKVFILTLLVLSLLFFCSCAVIDGGDAMKQGVNSTSSEKTTETTTEKASEKTTGITNTTTEEAVTKAEKTTASTSASTVKTTEKTTVKTTQASTSATPSTTTTTKTTTRNGENSQSSDGGFFDDAVLVGDSVTLKLSYYADKRRAGGYECLGKARFICAGSLGYTNALWDLNAKDNVHPRFNGTKYRVPDAVKVSGAKKAFVLLGMNDFMLYGIDATVENAEKLIEEIVQKSPGIEIYVQSVTPIIRTRTGGKKTNENVDALNVKLKALCAEKGWTYLNVASVLKDTDGSLKPEYCSDPTSPGLGIHFTDAACEKWVGYLVQATAED